MKPGFAPSHILFAALKTLHCAAYTTRNWGIDDTVSRKQIYDLWEAIHEVPDILTRWKGKDTEEELLMYLREYTDKWKHPNLIAIYNNFLGETRNS